MSAQTEQPDYEALIDDVQKASRWVGVNARSPALARYDIEAEDKARAALLSAINGLKEENERLVKAICNCPIGPCPTLAGLALAELD